jgi:hypothetical protein
MIVTGRLAAGRVIDVNDFADLTLVEVTNIGWNAEGLLELEFSEDLDDDTVRKVQRRMSSENWTDEQYLEAVAVNLAAIADWSPTGQTVATLTAQVARLSKQVIVLSRRALRDTE